MAFFELRKIIKNGNEIQYEYEVPAHVKKYLNSTKLFVEYLDEIDLDEVPDAVLTIPFVANMLTISMLTGCGIRVHSLDKEFFDSVSEIEKVYRSMFPYLRLTFVVKADEIVKCNYEAKGDKSLFFTGGLDATSALAHVYEKELTLINIWGGRCRIRRYRDT